MAQLRAAAIRVMDGSFNIIESAAPVVGLGALPYAFTGSKEATDATDGAFGKGLRTAIAGLNLYAFAHSWDGGFRQVTNNLHPIAVPDDLKGLKIRTAPSPTAVKTFRSLGAAPTAVDGSEMYSAAQTHIIDGTDLPLPSIEAFKMYEVQKFASIVNWAWTGSFLVVNSDVWRRTPSPLRDAIEQSVEEAALLERADMIKLELRMRSTLQGDGMAINAANIPDFKARITAAGLYKEWRSQYGADMFKLLEDAVGKLV